MDLGQIVGSFWEYGALVVILLALNYMQWKRNIELTDKVIELATSLEEPLNELKRLIEGKDGH